MNAYAIVTQIVEAKSAQLYQEQVVQCLDVIDGMIFNPNLDGAQFLYRFLLRAMTNLSFLDPVVVKDMYLVWFQIAIGKVTSCANLNPLVINFPALLMVALKEVERFPLKTSFHWQCLISICNGLREELNDDEHVLIQQPLFGYILHYLLIPQLQNDLQNVDANANLVSPLAFILPKETHPVSGWLVYHIAPRVLNVAKTRGFKMRRYLSQYRHLIKKLKHQLQLVPTLTPTPAQGQAQAQAPELITGLLFEDTNAAWLYAHDPEMFADTMMKKTTAQVLLPSRGL